MGKEKYSIEHRIETVKAYERGEGSYRTIAQRYRVGYTTVKAWVRKYRNQGESGLMARHGRSNYSSAFKIQCVEAFIQGEGSVDAITAKYNISSREVLRSWIKCYNANKKLKNYDPKREVYMAEAKRKTTMAERKEIAEYCISHAKNYAGTAAHYDVSYSQVYSWVKKYLTSGETGLADNRGHRKTDDEVDELERLRRENLRLKRELKEQSMVVELLKKAKEFERE